VTISARTGAELAERPPGHAVRQDGELELRELGGAAHEGAGHSDRLRPIRQYAARLVKAGGDLVSVR
jgi:hypothetical protein